MPTDETKTKQPPRPVERPLISLYGAPARQGRPAVVGLVEEFGEAEGRAKYNAIARLEGEMTMPGTGERYTGRYFFDPDAEGPGYRPDLIIATLPADARRAAAEILSTPQVKE